MTTVTKQFLSGSTNGRPIKVVASATPGTTLHTSDATAKDEVWLWVSNTDSVDRAVTVEFGGTTSPDDKIVTIVPAGDTVLVVAGIPISGGLLVKAFGAAANVLTAHGYVNRIS
jgi:hypothetical protein